MRKVFSVATIFCVCALSVAASCAASAQTKDNVLRGVEKVNLFIDDLEPGAAECGVTKEKLRDAFMARVVSAPFSVLPVSDPSAATLYLRASVMPLQIENGPCVTNIALRIYGYQKVHLQATNREVFAGVELWDKGGMLATARAIHGAAIIDAVSQRTQELVTAWTKDNPR